MLPLDVGIPVLLPGESADAPHCDDSYPPNSAALPIAADDISLPFEDVP